MSDITLTGVSGYGIGQIDSATVLVNGVSPRRAQHVNGPASAVVQIEQILGSGTTLKGSMADLTARLAVALNSTGTIKLDGFTGLTTDRGLMAVNATTMQVMNHTPIGVMFDYGGSSAPVNWLLCDGQAVSRTTYAKLFAVIGTTFGVGDGSTTFNVPDRRGRVSVMIDGSANRITSASTNGANADTLGGVGGTETHTLTAAQIPALDVKVALAGGGAVTEINSPLATTSSTQTLTGKANPTGGGNSHSNTQPWITVNVIIFAGV